MIWFRYLLLLLIIPAYAIALSRRRWATLPLWLVSACVMMVEFALNARQDALLIGGFAPSAFLWVAETTKILAIPTAVQLAVILKARQSDVGTRTESASPALMATVSANRL
jgi:hypothetical protein